MIEMVPKVIQIEHAYEVEAGCMEEEFFYVQQNNVQYANATDYIQSPTRAAYDQSAGPH